MPEGPSLRQGVRVVTILYHKLKIFADIDPLFFFNNEGGAGIARLEQVTLTAINIKTVHDHVRKERRPLGSPREIKRQAGVYFVCVYFVCVCISVHSGDS